ncbi:Gfo/Idh/MocA family protein [Paracoccus aminovorans]|uniref:Gfo/Idh/MocA family protein n=1 Tax=Paracoccus aminovorans TaxID=34004 RepID=UPI0007849EDB|nr:Gfo/Idh/MocA family oxidoreductase [Paracoccus aminovorans]MDQ7777131.1 Gfo/Idh/MocA family oxidoreductase [Paracoccus aminovorans]
MSGEIRAAIIGLGRWGQALADANIANPASALRLTHGATRSPEKADAWCRDRGLGLFGSYEEVLADPRIDAVVLATPHSQHARQIIQAAEAGKHVFVEKPLALRLEDAQAATAAAEAAGIRLCVGFNRRFLPGFRRMEQIACDGGLGQLLHVEGAFSGSFGYQYTAGMWRGDTAENPAGGMAAMGVHILDAMIALLGPVRRVAAISRHVAVPSDLRDVTNVALDFASGATGSLSTLMSTASFWRLHLFGGQGWAQMPDQHTLVTADLSGTPHSEGFAASDSLAQELDAFARAVAWNAPYPVTASQALAGVAAMAAIADSAACDGAWTAVQAEGAAGVALTGPACHAPSFG